MSIAATQLRVGMIIELDGDLYRVTAFQHVKPGKGVAYMQTELKGVINNKNRNERFRSADQVDRVALIEKPMQFLYMEADNAVFMDEETFEQYQMSKDLLGDSESFLKDGETFTVGVYEEQLLTIVLPKSIELTVTEAPPEIRKATASSSLRPIVVENGMTVKAPAFIKEGDRIRVNTETMEYIERVK